MTGTTVPRKVAGFAAIGVLLAMAFFLPSWGNLRQRAVVEAARTFALSSIEAGGYEWSLRDGMPARGEGLLQERVQQFDRAETMEMRITPGLVSGMSIQEGDELARLVAPHLEAQRARLVAERDAKVAERALLAAGARPEEVTSAVRELELARGVRDGELPSLARARTLAEEGALSQAELETIEAQARVRDLEVALAQAEVDLARSPAQPEEQAVLTAEIAALDAQITQMDRLLEDNVIRSPITGIAEMGGNSFVVRVYDLGKAYLRIPIPETSRLLVERDAAVKFTTPSSPDRVFEGRIVDLSEDASTLNSAQVFWASAEIDNPDNALRSGMSGVARIHMASGAGVFAWLAYELWGF